MSSGLHLNAPIDFFRYTHRRVFIKESTIHNLAKTDPLYYELTH